MLTPDASAEKTATPQLGWVVVIEAIHIPGQLTSFSTPSTPEGSAFAGRAEAREARAERYTHTAIPPDVSPEQLIAIFVAAMREKNWELYLEALDPTVRDDGDWPRDAWLISQRKLASDYVAIVPVADTLVVFDLEDGSQQARILVARFDETGKQDGSARPVYLMRSNPRARWNVKNGFPF